MIISKEQQRRNKESFLCFVRQAFPYSLDKKNRFIEWLEGTDFFTAPASTKGNLACEGGLCRHTLDVLDNAIQIQRGLFPSGDTGKVQIKDIEVASILHDISKTNYYETYVANKKVYSENGSKFDEHGRFDWIAVTAYRVKEPSDRFVYASLSQTSEFMARQFFDINLEVSCAILHHKGPYDENTSTGSQLGTIFSAHPAAAILHAADFLATHIQTGEDEIA